jgi:hypothetical protein
MGALEQRFPLGALVATPGALELLGDLEVSPSELLERHASGDWGELDDHDRRANNAALRNGTRLLSSYPLDGGRKVWIITEADRSSTCILLPLEY